jgi:hypothetical protein
LTTAEAERFHKKKQPYVAIFSKSNAPNFIVKVNFNEEGSVCATIFLNEKLDSIRSESYVLLGHQLFLKNIQLKQYNGEKINLVNYLYEPDGRYRKNFFIDGLETDEVEYGQCDVSSHFREMIQFGNYDSILPKEAKKGLNG